MQVNSLAQSLGISKEEATLLYNNFKDSMKVAFDYGESVRRSCRANGYVKTILGRKRRFPEYTKPDFEVEGNVPPQTKQEIVKQLRYARWSERKDLLLALEHKYKCVILDNTQQIRMSETEIVNSQIQGRLHRPYLLNPIT